MSVIEHLPEWQKRRAGKPSSRGSQTECPSCGSENPRVVDSRFFRVGYGPKRRRCCGACGHRWSTIEMPEDKFVILRRGNAIGMQLAKLPEAKRRVVLELVDLLSRERSA